MKKIALLLMCFSPTLAWAQGSRIDNIALGPRGPVPFASVAVCTQPATTTTTPCSPLATLYTDTTLGTTSANPVTADALGNYHFYAATGRYTVQVYSPQIAPPFVMIDQILSCDPSNCVVAAITDTSLTVGNCVQVGAGHVLTTVGGPCNTSGSSTVGGTTVAGEVAVGAASNNLQAYSNFLYNGTVLSVPGVTIGSGTTQTGVQGTDTNVQSAGTNSGTTGALLCNDASGGATTSGCSSQLDGPFVLVTAIDNTTVTTSATNVMHLSITIPSSGGPFRIMAQPSIFVAGSSATQGGDCWVTDGTNTWDYWEASQITAVRNTNVYGPSKLSNVTYAAGAGSITITARCQMIHSGDTWTVGNATVGPGVSQLSAWVSATN